jgi:hypothetical protein
MGYNGLPNLVPSYFCGRDVFVDEVVRRISGGTRMVQLQVGGERMHTHTYVLLMLMPH